MVLNEFECNWLALSARRSQLWIKSSRYTTVCYPVYNPHISYEPFSTFNRGSQRLTARNHRILWCSFSNSLVSGSNFKMKSALFCRPTEREIPCWDHRETIILWRRPGSRELSLLFTTPKLETENRTRNINRSPCLCSNNINITKIHGNHKHMIIIMMIRASTERFSLNLYWKISGAKLIQIRIQFNAIVENSIPQFVAGMKAWWLYTCFVFVHPWFADKGQINLWNRLSIPQVLIRIVDSTPYVSKCKFSRTGYRTVYLQLIEAWEDNPNLKLVSIYLSEPEITFQRMFHFFDRTSNLHNIIQFSI